MPTQFAQSELEQALSEIPWGYQGYTLLPDDPQRRGEARVEIRLLETPETVIASCSDHGWTLLDSRGDAVKPFDTLDDLMLDVSPLFQQVRMRKLAEKLAQVANELPKPRWAFADQDDDSTAAQYGV